jgi:hypothetical protein
MGWDDGMMGYRIRYGKSHGMRIATGLEEGCMVLALAFGYEIPDIDRGCVYGVWSKRSVGARLLRYT